MAKDTFSARTFGAQTFANGDFRGTGTAPPAPAGDQFPLLGFAGTAEGRGRMVVVRSPRSRRRKRDVDVAAALLLLGW